MAISFPAVLVGLETFALRDFGLFGYPLAAYHHHCFWNGEIPLWNPLNECGLPFLAQWNTLVLYPGSLIYLLLPLPWSVNLFCLVHLYLGGLGAFVLARHWKCRGGAAAFAGVAYAFNGLLQNSLMWPNNIAALGLFPWVVWSVQRCWSVGGRAYVSASLLGAMQMLTGAPEVILFTWCFIGVVWFAEVLTQTESVRPIAQRLGRLLAVISIISLLAAAQLLPFFSLLSLVDRASQFDGSMWSATPFSWLNLLLPLFDTMRSPIGQVTHLSQAWTHSVYAGTATCALALHAMVSRPVKPAHVLGVLLIGFVAISSGQDGWLYEYLAAVLPLDSLRFPIKFLIPCSFMLPLLAAIGIREWQSAPVPPSRVAVLAVVVALIMAGGGWLDAGVINPDRDFDWIAYLVPRMVSLVVILTALYALRRYVNQSGTRLPVCLWGIIFVTCWADLRFHQPNLASSVPSDRLTADSEVPSNGRSAITADTTRVVKRLHLPSLEETLQQHRDSLFCNLNLISGDSQVEGFYSLRLPRSRIARRTLYNGFYEVHAPMADFLGVDRVGRHTMGIIEWQPWPTALPLVTVGQNPLFGEGEKLLGAMHSSRFDPRQMVLFEAGNEDAITGGAAPGSKASVIFQSSGKIELEVNAPAPAIVVIAQAHHPNWTAQVNGEETPIHISNYAFQAVNVPAGTSRLTLVYVDPEFRLGLMLSLLGMAIVLVLWFRTRPVPIDTEQKPKE